MAGASSWFRNQVALHGPFSVDGDNFRCESRAAVNQYDMTAADSENGDGSHPSPVVTPRQLGDSESETEPEVTMGLLRNVILRMALDFGRCGPAR